MPDHNPAIPMTTDPFPGPSIGSNPPLPNGQPAQPTAKSRRLPEGQYGQLPRLIGGGVLLLYTLAVVQLLLNYQRGNPTSEYAIETGILEQIPILLLAYGLLTWPGLAEPRRHLGRVLLKLVSLSALAVSLLHLGLGLLCVLASVDVYQQATITADRQTAEQLFVGDRIIQSAPTMETDRLRALYAELFPEARRSGKIPTAADDLRTAINRQASAQKHEIQANLEPSAGLQLRHQQIFGTIKYPAMALLGAILFLLIWDFTFSLRTVGIFPPAKDPNLAGLSRIGRAFQRFTNLGEKVFTPPNLEEYRWYRHFRRWLRRRFSKKD